MCAQTPSALTAPTAHTAPTPPRHPPSLTAPTALAHRPTPPPHHPGRPCNCKTFGPERNELETAPWITGSCNVPESQLHGIEDG